MPILPVALSLCSGGKEAKATISAGGFQAMAGLAVIDSCSISRVDFSIYFAPGIMDPLPHLPLTLITNILLVERSAGISTNGC